MLNKLARGVDGLDFGVSGSRLLLPPTGSGVAFIYCIQSRIVFGFCVCWKKRWWLFVLITFIRSQTGVGLLVSSCPGTGSGTDSDSRFAKQDWFGNKKLVSPHSDATSDVFTSDLIFFREISDVWCFGHKSNIDWAFVCFPSSLLSF